MDIEELVNILLDTNVLNLTIDGEPITNDMLETRKKKEPKKKELNINLTDNINLNYKLSYTYNININLKKENNIYKYIYLKKESPNSESLTSELKSTNQKSNKDNYIELKFDDMANKLAEIYKLYNYSNKWHKSVTMKRVVRLVNNVHIKDRCNPNHIIYAFTAYLSEMNALGRETQYIINSEKFVTNYLGDYLERTKSLYEEKMEEKYGKNWKKLRFRIVD